MPEHDECRETYKACTAARHERAQKVVEERQPGDTVADLAEKADVSKRTIERLLQSPPRGGECNNASKPEVPEFPEPLEFEAEHPAVGKFREDVNRAFKRLRGEELYYVWAHVLPELTEWYRPEGAKRC